MLRSSNNLLRSVPGVDHLLRLDAAAALVAAYGRELVVQAMRSAVDDLRAALDTSGETGLPADVDHTLVAAASRYLSDLDTPSLRPVYNLTGTVLHTNLGRAALPQEAIDAINAVAAGASNLEFDLESGRRGERDAHVEDWLCRLTGAEAATVVNNNAAALLLVLNTLARRKEVPVSRGELVEIGGSFRIPDVMARAGTKLIEVGTTNRTHLRDFEQAVGEKTALVMKVHTSNYVIEGFTAAVSEPELAALATGAQIPFVVDLGSGSLLDLTRFGLPPEPTVAATLRGGADVVTFSGDKLLGGPQAGIIAGRANLIARIKRNPMKRALRVDKFTLAALGAVLRLYADPDTLPQKLPTLRWLMRPTAELQAVAARLIAPLNQALGAGVKISVTDCHSQIGSGALPIELLPSAAISLQPAAKRGAGRMLERLGRAFRALPKPVVGRVEHGSLLLDLRCLDDEAGFVAQLEQLDLKGGTS